MVFLKIVVITILIGLSGFLFDCTIRHSTVSNRNTDVSQAVLTKSHLPNQEGTSKDRPVPEIVEKKRFVDMVKLQNEQAQMVVTPAKNRSEILLPGDHIEIILYEKLPVSQEKRVEMKRIDDEGAVFIYPLGNLMIAGLTLTQAREIIEKKMEAYIITPFCEITLIKRGYEPHVFVFGEVMKRGSILINGGDRLLDVLSSAGGTSPDAYIASVKIVRLYGDSIGVMSINIGDIIKRGHVENNLIMQDQDIVYIPKSLLSGVTEVLAKLGSVLPWYYFVKNF